MSKEKVIYVSQKVLEITYFAFRQADYDWSQLYTLKPKDVGFQWGI